MRQDEGVKTRVRTKVGEKRCYASVHHPRMGIVRFSVSQEVEKDKVGGKKREESAFFGHI